MDAIAFGFISYLFLILFVGLYTVKKTKNLQDYALGGHKLGPIVIAFSERASGESAWLILGLPGAAMLFGMLEIWTVIGCLSGIILSWILLAYPLRKEVEKYNVLTLPEYFEKKYDDRMGVIRIISSLIITFFFTFYIAAQFSGAGKVLNITFGFTQFNGMVIATIIIIFYTLLGGFTAVAFTDLVQGIIMFCTLVILPIVGFFEISTNNMSEIIHWGTLYGGETSKNASIAASIGGLSWGLGYLGQPHLIARYMAIDKPEHIKISRKIAFAWAIPAFFGAMFTGLIGKVLVDSGVLLLNGNIINSINDIPDPEKIMPILANNLLPNWLAGIFISGAIAAMMSTADSQLLVSTTILTKDIVNRYLFQSLSDSKLLVFSRIFTILIGVIAFYMAMKSEKLVLEMVSYAWGGLGSSFGPVIVLTLWWKKIRKEGVVAGLISGTFFTIYPMYNSLITPRVSAFVLSMISIIIISKFKDYLD